MSLHLFLQGVLLGLVVAVPVGPLGLFCISRALMLGPTHGLFSGLGVATADAFAAAVAAFGLSLVSNFLAAHQMPLRLIGGAFLCYLGSTIYAAEAATEAPIKNVSGLSGCYFTTFLLTVANPVTILSFAAIYAAWHVPSLDGRYIAAGTLTAGVFTGSALWWIALFIGMTAFRRFFSLRFLFWVHRASGALIALFGIIVLLSLSPWGRSLGLAP
jgi:threonine/homoserine/homoserine lactone efflux protein